MNETTAAQVKTLRALPACIDCFSPRNPPSGKSQSAADNVMTCNECAQIVLGWTEESFRSVLETQRTTKANIHLSDSEINELTAGNKLDRLVAEHVMGWHEDQQIPHGWSPSKNVTDAEVVFDQMKSVFGLKRSILAKSVDGRYHLVYFGSYSSDGLTPEEAICKAALLAVVNIRREKGEYDAHNSGILCDVMNKKMLSDYEIDSLKAGKELDALVTEHVPGSYECVSPGEWAPSARQADAKIISERIEPVFGLRARRMQEG